MPHKHKRDKASDKSVYELNPAIHAKPLPVTKSIKGPTGKVEPSKKPSLKRKRPNKDAFEDDTPRAFSRLMAFTQGKKPPSGLDDGIVKSKKRKTVPAPSTDTQATTTTATKAAPLQIKPGERMNDFSARVDQALPVLGLIGRGTNGVKDLPGVKKHKTRHEKRMHKMYDEWRVVEAKRKEALLEAKEEAEEEEDPWEGIIIKSRKGKRGKKGGGSEDEDPWAAVGKKGKDGEGKKGLVGLHDVVQAPPQFTKVPKEKFRVLNGARVDVADVPNKVGSLRRREELVEARRGVVEGYRRMMRERKGVDG